jgi:hypothetical protein
MKKEIKIRGGFQFFRSFKEAIDRVNEKDQLALYRGIVCYALDHLEPTFNDPLLELIWTLIKPNLDSGWYHFINGCGGGAPIGNNNASKTTKKQPRNNQKTTKEQPKNNQPIYDKEKENGKEIEENNVSIETKEDIEETTAGPSVSLSSDYQNFIDWLNKNCTHLLKMNIPTEEEYQKLMEAADQSKKILTGKLLAMENNKDVPKTKRSIYRTCLEWLKRDKR